MRKMLAPLPRLKYFQINYSVKLCILLLGLSIAGVYHTAQAQPKLKVATCQFPVSGDLHRNANYIKDFIRKAAVEKADVVHFSEASLTGYPPMDIKSFDNYDWNALSKETKDIMTLAKELNVWVILGSAHYIAAGVKPTNCLYIISNKGEIIDRYDKSMLTDGDDSDTSFYSPGNHICVVDINGFKCGFLICYDSCFPEMYNIYRHKGVKIVFHSFYNAHHKGRTILDEVIPAEIRVRASDNLMWVVANNSTGDYSSWPTCIARPDGSLEALQRGVPGILYRQFPDKEITSEVRSWTHNNKSMVLPPKEVYHNGVPSNRPRALDRKSLPFAGTAKSVDLSSTLNDFADSSYEFPSTGTLSKVAIRAVPTFQAISLYWKPQGGAANHEALVRYKIKGTKNWSEAQSLWFDDRIPDSIGGSVNVDRSKEYRGSIVNLRSGTPYQIEVFLTGLNQVARTTIATMNEHFPIAKTVMLPAKSNSPLVITEGGSPKGYVLYTGPAGATIDVGNAHMYAVDIRAPYVIVKGLIIKGAQSKDVRIAAGLSNIVIDGNDISEWGRLASDGGALHDEMGIGSDNVDYSKVKRIIIQNNKIHHPRYGSNSWTQYRTFLSTYHPIGTNAIGFNGDAGQIIIRNNKIYSSPGKYFMDGIGGSENFSFTSGFPGPDSDIYGNSISNCWDDAIESEGMNQNVRVFNNYIDLAYVAHGVSATSIGPLYVYRNITNRLQRSAELSLNSGYWFKSQGVDAFGGRVYVYHNTMLTNEDDGGISDVSRVLANTISRNNILRSTNKAVKDLKGDPQTSCDYDLIDGKIMSVNPNHEKHAIFATPQFDMNEPENARGLLPNTPGQDSGAIRIPNFNDNYKGKAPDMGAVEN